MGMLEDSAFDGFEVSVSGVYIIKDIKKKVN